MGWVGRLSGASASLLPRKSGAGEDEERFGGVGDGCSDAWRESGGKAVASTRYTNLSYLSACRFRVRVRLGVGFGFGLGLGLGLGFGLGLGLGLGLGSGIGFGLACPPAACRRRSAGCRRGAGIAARDRCHSLR